MQVGDVVRGTGIGKVKSMGYDSATIEITEHPDPSVVGRVYSAPKSHFEVVPVENVAQEIPGLYSGPEYVLEGPAVHVFINKDGKATVAEPLSLEEVLKVNPTMVIKNDGKPKTEIVRVEGRAVEPVRVEGRKVGFLKRLFGGNK